MQYGLFPLRFVLQPAHPVEVQEDVLIIILSDIDHLVCQLHGSDDIQHIGRFPDSFFLQQIEMIQTGAADQYLQPVFFVLLEILENRRTVDGQFDPVVYQDQSPQFPAHFFQCAQEIDHQLQAQLMVAEADTIAGAHDHDLFFIGFLHRGWPELLTGR